MSKILSCFFFMGQSLWGEIVPLISLPKMRMVKEKFLSCPLCQRTSTRLGRRTAPGGRCLDSIGLCGISVCIDQSEFVCTVDGDCAQIRVCTEEWMHRENGDCTEKSKCMSVSWRVCTEQSECAQKMRVHTSECVYTGQNASASSPGAMIHLTLILTVAFFFWLTDTLMWT